MDSGLYVRVVLLNLNRQGRVIGPRSNLLMWVVVSLGLRTCRYTFTWNLSREYLLNSLNHDQNNDET